MSFEGYEMVLCENGHLYEDDVYGSWFSAEWACPVCGAREAWHHTVDQTNGDDDPNAKRPELEEIEPARYERCNLGHYHLWSPSRYKVPRREP